MRRFNGRLWPVCWFSNGCLGYPTQGSGTADDINFQDLSDNGKRQLEEFVARIDPVTLRSLQMVIGKIISLREPPPHLPSHHQLPRHRRRKRAPLPAPPAQPHLPPPPHAPPRLPPPPSLEQIREESPPHVGVDPKAEPDQDPVLHHVQGPLLEPPQPHAHRGHAYPGPGHQELYPGCGVYLSTVRLAAMLQESRQDCMRLFHQLFEHFFSEDDLMGAVAFGKRGKVPTGKKVLDRRIVDGIITYVLRCSTLDGWTSVDSGKLKKACINKCRMRMSQRRRLGQMSFFNPEHYMMGPSYLQQSPDGF